MNFIIKFSFCILLFMIHTVNCSASSASNGPKVTDMVYFDLTQDGKPLGRVEIGLFGGTGN